MLARGNRGFSLLELLVVVTIVAILAAVVVLGFVGSDKAQELRTEAERLAQLIELARDEAILRNQELGLVVEDGSYRFTLYDDAEQQWQALESAPFRPRALELIDIVVNVERVQSRPSEEGQPERETGRAGSRFGSRQNVPQIIFYSSGEQTPFEIALEPPEAWGAGTWLVRSDGLARTSAERST